MSNGKCKFNKQKIMNRKHNKYYLSFHMGVKPLAVIFLELSRRVVQNGR